MQAGGIPPKFPLSPENGQPPTVGDAFVPGAYPTWEPPTFPPPVWQPPVQDAGVGPGCYGGFRPLTLGPPPDWKGAELAMTYGDLTKAGSLVLVDQFLPPALPMSGIGGSSAPIELAHGHLVSESAKGQGFAGNLIPSQHLGAYHQEKQIISQGLNEPDLPREVFLQRLEMSVALQGVGLLDSMTSRLNGLKEAGLHHSAVNLSFGMSQASAVQGKYMEASMAWSGWEPIGDFKKPLLENYARAFELDAEKLRHQDPAISGPERAKFQQALADQVADIMENNPALKESKGHFSSAVQELEKNHNSVVIAASNEGSVIQQLQKHANCDIPLRVGERFQDNILATPETTVVGSTVGCGPSEKVAEYSSNYAEVDIYANGVAPLPASTSDKENADGTSFAAPKVAQAMAKLHELYPDKSSAEIEDLLKEQLSHQLLSYDGRVERPVLNDQADFGMLSRYT